MSQSVLSGQDRRSVLGEQDGSTVTAKTVFADAKVAGVRVVDEHRGTGADHDRIAIGIKRTAHQTRNHAAIEHLPVAAEILAHLNVAAQTEGHDAAAYRYQAEHRAR